MRLDYIDYRVAREQWQAITGSQWIHVDKVKPGIYMTRYLCKYLTKSWEINPTRRSYWYSFTWIYRKWRAFSHCVFIMSGIPVGTPEHQLLHDCSRETAMLHMARRLEYTFGGMKCDLIKAVQNLKTCLRMGFLHYNAPTLDYV